MTCNLVTSNTCLDHLHSRVSKNSDRLSARWKTFHWHLSDINVKPGEEIAKQQYLLVSDFRAEIWGKLKCSLLKADKNVCGFIKKQRWRKETCWWNATVNNAVKQTWRCWNRWNKGGSKEEYQKAKQLGAKLSRTVQPADPTKWDVETWMSNVRNMSTMMLESCAWMTGLSRQTRKSTMSPSQM